jgi:hypothetical protein
MMRPLSKPVFRAASGQPFRPIVAQPDGDCISHLHLMEHHLAGAAKQAGGKTAGPLITIRTTVSG